MDANELLKELEGIAIRTTQGMFVKMDDAKALVARRVKEQEAEVEKKDQPKSFAEAKIAVKKDKKLMDSLPKPIIQAGRAVPASVNEPPSVVEDVKA